MSVCPPGGEFMESLLPDQSAFVFVTDGTITIGERGTKNSRTVSSRQLAVLGHGKQVTIVADDHACRFLLVAGDPIGEAGLTPWTLRHEHPRGDHPGCARL